MVTEVGLATGTGPRSPWTRRILLALATAAIAGLLAAAAGVIPATPSLCIGAAAALLLTTAAAFAENGGAIAAAEADGYAKRR